MDEVRLTEPHDIENHVLDYFQEIFGVNNSCIPNDLVSTVIPSLVTDQDNLMLIAAPGVDEIKQAVFDLNGDGVPGPGGSGGHFFQFFGTLWLLMWFPRFKISFIPNGWHLYACALFHLINEVLFVTVACLTVLL